MFASAQVVDLRREQNALTKVANGLLEIIRGNDACNIFTMARMAVEAKEAAAQIASMIERLLMGEVEKEKKSSSAFGRIKKIVLDFAVALLCCA